MEYRSSYKRNKAIIDKNYDKYGVDININKIYSLANLPVILILLIIGLKGWYSDPFYIIRLIFLVSAIISVVSLSFSLFKNMTIKFLRLSYILVSMNVLITMIWVNFIGIALFVSKEGGNSPEDYISLEIWFYIIPMFLLFFISLIFWNKFLNSGKLKNLMQQGPSKASVNIPIIFAVVMFVRPIMDHTITGTKVGGIIAGTIITAVLPLLIVGSIKSAKRVK